MAQIRQLIAVVVFSTVALAAQSPAPVPEAIVDTPEFMTWMMKPAYTDLQRMVHTPPADRAAWAAIYQQAIRLAETSNLLFLRHHAGAETPPWAERSAGIRRAAAGVADAAMHGLQSVRASDYDSVKTAFAQVPQACNACHRQFGGTNAPTIRE